MLSTVLILHYCCKNNAKEGGALFCVNSNFRKKKACKSLENEIGYIYNSVIGFIT